MHALSNWLLQSGRYGALCVMCCIGMLLFLSLLILLLSSFMQKI